MTENLKQRRYLDNRDRILRNVIVAPSGCWIWIRRRDAGGYGQTKVPVAPGQPLRTQMAHRLSYEAFVGPIPPGLHIDHLCRVRHCVNPRHLQPVTPKVNALRGQTLTARNAAKTRCSAGHPYTEANLRILAIGHRRCRACEAIGAAKRRRESSGLPDGDVRHGTAGGYGNHGCRCRPCTRAHSAQSVANKRVRRGAR